MLYMFGHLSKQERQERYVSKYLKSPTVYFPSHWLCQLIKCLGTEDIREQSRRNVRAKISDLAVSWSRDRVVIASAIGICFWSLSRQIELLRVPIDVEDSVDCLAMSEDVKCIVSGHESGTVQN